LLSSIGDAIGKLFGGGGGSDSGGGIADSVDSTIATIAGNDITAAAKGGVFGGSRALRAYENQIVEAPTMFRFAAGGSVGMMGEAGPEAILPLKRGTDGKLGISAGAVNQAGAQPVVHNWNITTPDPGTFMNSRRQIESKYSSSMGRTAARNST
jgi:lambda family phage tail tape measure protein